MKIITINLPDTYVEALEKLTADLGVFTSRSEAIREALLEFVDEELGHAKEIERLNALKVQQPPLFF
ncbi:MAG: hypothetical protein Kow0069_26850 [Promethearchaeota archaeon]